MRSRPNKSTGPIANSTGRLHGRVDDHCVEVDPTTWHAGHLHRMDVDRPARPDNIITHPSSPRYKGPAKAMAVLRLAEREGIGIDRMIAAMLVNAAGSTYPLPKGRRPR